ncbi:hypothetical protein [Aeromonas media]|uniref:hypothetical protein n=1 Tax=Aeromonas media TaxID=651 RepID=UPI003D1A9291
MIDHFEWLQLVKDVVIPVSSTLTGAAVAYVVAKKGSESQRALLEQERGLAVLVRIYHLLQEFEKYGACCRDSYSLYCRDKSQSVDQLRHDILSAGDEFDIRELERLIELNFKCFSEALRDNKAMLIRLLMMVSSGERAMVVDVNSHYGQMREGIISMMDAVAEHSEKIRGG